MEKGTLIAVGGNIYEYYKYDEKVRLHIVSEVEVEEDGNLVATFIPHAFTDEELKDNAVNFTETQWCGIVGHFIRQDYDLPEEEINNAAEDIVFRCFAYGVPKIEELPEYIAEYINR